MAELKTQPTSASVTDYLMAISDPVQRSDSLALMTLLQEVTGAPAVMWGDSIVGFGQQHLTYASGRQIDYFVAGFAPRKGKLSLYLTGDLRPFAAQIARLEKLQRGVGCIYIKRLADIDQGALRELIAVVLAAD